MVLQHIQYMQHTAQHHTSNISKIDRIYCVFITLYIVLFPVGIPLTYHALLPSFSLPISLSLILSLSLSFSLPISLSLYLSLSPSLSLSLSPSLSLSFSLSLSLSLILSLSLSLFSHIRFSLLRCGLGFFSPKLSSASHHLQIVFINCNIVYKFIIWSYTLCSYVPSPLRKYG